MRGFESKLRLPKNSKAFEFFSWRVQKFDKVTLQLPMSFPQCIPAAEYRKQGPQDIVLPVPEEDGRIKTANPEGGYMTQSNLGISTDFLNFCRTSAKAPVFDGGAAFGIATFAALEAGATVIANDIETLHLHYIAQHAGEHADRLYLREGPLPGSLDFPEASLSAIHLSRVLHFLGVDDFVKVFENAFKALVPSGRFFVVVASPYHWASPGFAVDYEERLKQGVKMPGICDGAWKKKRFGEAQDDGRFLHMIDPRVMIRLAYEVGFIVKRVQLMGEQDEGFDYTGAILIKPPLA
jgi:SAM-dependent methyltransferase